MQDPERRSHQDTDSRDSRPLAMAGVLWDYVLSTAKSGTPYVSGLPE